MRIRKHASKILGSAASFAWLSSSAPLEDLLLVSALGDVCELNRSPWDVVLPSPASTADSDHPKQEVEREESTGNWIPREEAISVIPDKTRLAEAEPDVKKDNERNAVVKDCCKKNDGRGWRCKKPAQLPRALCEHHLGRGRGCNLAHNPSTAPALICRSSHHRNHPDNKKKTTKKAAAKADAESDFYYYSEFGPWRRKRRSGDGGGVGSGGGVGEIVEREDHLKSDHYDGEQPSECEGEGENLDDCAGIDGHDDTVEDQGDGDGCGWKDVANKSANGKRGGRKRIKARSLSSLL